MAVPAALVVLTEEQLEAVVERGVRKALAAANAREVMSVPEAARYANRAVETVRDWIGTGELTAAKRGRVWAIRREDLDRYLAGDRRSDVPSAKELVASLKPRR